MKRAFLLALAVSLTAPTVASAQDAGPFSQGKLRISAGLGGGFNSHLIIGVGAGYYVIDGLEVGLDNTYWLIEDPTLITLSPSVRYVLHFVPVVKPYVGGFYKHWFVLDEEWGPDLDSLGVRGGLFFVWGRGSFVGGGVVYEVIVTDKQRIFADDAQIYPEIALSLSF